MTTTGAYRASWTRRYETTLWFLGLLRHVARIDRWPSTVVDLGCGAGAAVRAADALGMRAVGVDLHAPSLVVEAHGSRIEQADLRCPWSLREDEPPADLVLCWGVYEHMRTEDERLSLVRAALRSTRVGGRSVWLVLAEEDEQWEFDILHGLRRLRFDGRVSWLDELLDAWQLTARRSEWLDSRRLGWVTREEAER